MSLVSVNACGVVVVLSATVVVVASGAAVDSGPDPLPPQDAIRAGAATTRPKARKMQDRVRV